MKSPSTQPRHPRGPLRHIVMAATGEDIRSCAHCGVCEAAMTPEMDLSLAQLLHAACRDDPCALHSQTLWSCDRTLAEQGTCQAGLDLTAVVHALRQEAERRGISPKPASGAAKT